MRPGPSRGVATAAELLRMPHDNRRLELVRGELRAAEPAGSRHGRIAAEITASLWSHARARRLGQVFTSDAGYWIERDPDTVRAPDVAFVSRERFEAVGDTVGYWPGPPDLAVEVLSPDDRPAAVREKVDDWLRAGCKLVLVVDPERRLVRVHTASGDPATLGGNEMIDGGQVVPGWRLPVAEVFALE